jgi:hypothetical protein
MVDGGAQTDQFGHLGADSRNILVHRRGTAATKMSSGTASCRSSFPGSGWNQILGPSPELHDSSTFQVSPWLGDALPEETLVFAVPERPC